MSMVEKYFDMTFSISLSTNFGQREVARRFAAIPLISVEVVEIAFNIFKMPIDGFVKLSIMAGKKVFSGSPQVTWEKQWQPMETLKKVGCLVLGLLSTIIIGWWMPKWSHQIHEKLNLAKTSLPIPKIDTLKSFTSKPKSDKKNDERIKELEDQVNELQISLNETRDNRSTLGVSDSNTV